MCDSQSIKTMSTLEEDRREEEEEDGEYSQDREEEEEEKKPLTKEDKKIIHVISYERSAKNWADRRSGRDEERAARDMILNGTMPKVPVKLDGRAVDQIKVNIRGFQWAINRRVHEWLTGRDPNAILARHFPTVLYRQLISYAGAVVDVINKNPSRDVYLGALFRAFETDLEGVKAEATKYSETYDTLKNKQ